MYKDLTIFVCNYNTPILIAFLIKSIFKQVPNFNGKIVVWENSDKEDKVFPISSSNLIKIIDNTKCTFVKKFRNDVHNASPFHCASIDFFIRNFLDTKYMLLMDSDILIKKDFTDLFLEFSTYQYAVCGEYSQTDPSIPPKRFVPFFCFINKEIMDKNNLIYFDINRIRHGGVTVNYDTGSSFSEDILTKKLIYKTIVCFDYIEHLGGGSYLDRDIPSFLNSNKEFF